MLAISASAVPHLLSLIGEGGAPTLEAAGEQSQRGLRVFVEKGGCAGLQYGMKVDSVREGDLISERDGARVMVDPESAGYLQGAHLDYCDDLTGTGFRIENPNAVRSCGCGTSFEPSDSGSGISEAVDASQTAGASGTGGL